ncbi:MAG: NYN domain-containing protein [Kiritimatiellia bacterium]|jgi:hypothetical protein
MSATRPKPLPETPEQPSGEEPQDVRPDTTVLPEALHGEVLALLEAVPDPEISRLTAAVQGKGGFRQNTKPSLLRANLGKAIRPGNALSPALRRALARQSLQPSLVAPATPAHLKANLGAYAAVCGAPRFLVSLWLDSRDDVRALALEGAAKFLGETPAEALPAPDEAAAHLRERLAPLLARLGARDGGTPPAAGAADAADLLRNELADLKRENRRLRNSDEQLRRALERERAREGDVRALRDERDEARRAAAAADRRIAELEASLQRHREENRQRTAAAVEQATAAAFSGWLARAARVAKAAETASDPSLFERARAALDNQAQEDASSGSFRAMRDRLRTLEGLRAQVREALADAVHPLPSLQAIATELDEERIRLRTLLGDVDDPAPSGFSETALQRAISAAAPEELPVLSELLERLSSLRVLDHITEGRLREMLHLRQALFQATTLPPSLLGAEWEKIRSGDPLWRLREAFAGQAPAIILVDGHNMLFALQSRYMSDGPATPVPGRAAREKLVSDFIRLVKGRPTVRVWIVFDGAEPNDASPAENVRVSYSGGEGQHRADRLLEANARYFHQAGATALFLVTNDGELAGNARKAGATPLAPTVFLPLF